MIASAEKTMRACCQFCTDYLFYGVPVKITRSNRDPLSNLWMRPDDIVTGGTSRSILNMMQLPIQLETLKMVPTTVLITATGQVTAVFAPGSEGEVTYHFFHSDIQQAHQRTGG